MICGEGTEVIAASPEEVLEFVLDLDRYRQADTKIGRIRSFERNGDEGTVRFGGKLRGIPAPPATFAWRLEPWTRLEFRSTPGFIHRFLTAFEGTFSCEEVEGGTRVVHRECFTFRAPGRWVLEPFLRDWLDEDTNQEMARVKTMLEAK